MEWQHPVFQDMLLLGCSDQMKIMIAYQAYINLCEVDKLQDVQFFYDKELDIVYLSSTAKTDRVLYVPVPIQCNLSPAWIHSTTSTLLKTHPNAVINFLLKTPDSSFLPYKVTEGLCPPPTPEFTKEKKALQEKKQYVQTELNKRKPELYEEARRKRSEQNEVLVSEQCGGEKVSEV